MKKAILVILFLSVSLLGFSQEDAFKPYKVGEYTVQRSEFIYDKNVGLVFYEYVSDRSGETVYVVSLYQELQFEPPIVMEHMGVLFGFQDGSFINPKNLAFDIEIERRGTYTTLTLPFIFTKEEMIKLSSLDLSRIIVIYDNPHLYKEKSRKDNRDFSGDFKKGLKRNIQKILK